MKLTEEKDLVNIIIKSGKKLTVLSAKTSELSRKVANGETVGVTFHYHNRFSNRFVNSLLTKVLSENNLVFLQSVIITILREMINNAVKANTKRLYFDIEKMNIDNADEYNIGMNEFKNFIVNKKELIDTELKKTKLRVWMYLKKIDNELKIIVKNNIPIHLFEKQRIDHRIEKSKQYNDFSEVYGEVMDDSEGEGLGIILTMLFLRNSGIGEDSFEIVSDDESTKSMLTVPFQLKPVAIVNKIQKRILDEVEELPSFPEHILRIMKMCRQPEVTINDLADTIKQDLSLTSSVLKLSNSAGFITRKRIEDVSDAIKLIGLRNLNSILIAASSRKIIDQRYSMFKQIWNHCNKVAFYGRSLALKIKKGKLSESVYLAGLLHDIGKIVLLSTNTKLTEWISDITVNKAIGTSTVIEEISIGLSHSSIGKLIAEKWNFPQYIVESIAFHHSPLNAEDVTRDVVELAYIANEMCNIEEKKADFDYIENSILEKYKIDDEEKFNKIHEDLKKNFSEHSELVEVK